MIKILKLITGETVIATVTYDEETVSLSNVYFLSFVKSGNVTLIPWVIGAKEQEEYILDKKFILVDTLPSSDLEISYKANFSKIKIVQNNPRNGIVTH